MRRKDFLKVMPVLPVGAVAALQSWQTELPSSEKMPVLFIGHGSPMYAIEKNRFTESLRAEGEKLRKTNAPTAILVVSAHWLTRGTFVEAAEKPKTIHDFGGFPDELFQQQYPAPGAPALARETAELLGSAGVSDGDWGLDHGAWTVMKHLFPSADVPTFQVSIDYHQPMSYHFELAKKLRKLREKGVLIIGSGNVVHNLRASFAGGLDPNRKPYDWNIEFDDWAKKRLENRDFQAFTDYEKQMGEAAKMAVPTVDHYVPLVYSAALADEKEDVSTIYEGLESGGISMRTVRFG